MRTTGRPAVSSSDLRDTLLPIAADGEPCGQTVQYMRKAVSDNPISLRYYGKFAADARFCFIAVRPSARRYGNTCRHGFGEDRQCKLMDLSIGWRDGRRRREEGGEGPPPFPQASRLLLMLFEVVRTIRDSWTTRRRAREFRKCGSF